MKKEQLRQYLSAGDTFVLSYEVTNDDTWDQFDRDTNPGEDDPYGPSEEEVKSIQSFLVEEKKAQPSNKNFSVLTEILVQLVTEYHFPVTLAVEIMDQNKRVDTLDPVSPYERPASEARSGRIPPFKEALRLALLDEVITYHFAVQLDDLIVYQELLTELRNQMQTDGWDTIQKVIEEIQMITKHRRQRGSKMQRPKIYLRWQLELMSIKAQRIATDLAEEYKFSYTKRLVTLRAIRRYYRNISKLFRNSPFPDTMLRRQVESLLASIEQSLEVEVGEKRKVTITDKFEKTRQFRNWFKSKSMA